MLEMVPEQRTSFSTVLKLLISEKDPWQPYIPFRDRDQGFKEAGQIVNYSLSLEEKEIQ